MGLAEAEPGGGLERIVRHLRVGSAWAGKTVYDAVRTAFPDLDPREVFRKARSGEIRRNARRCGALDRLAGGDTVAVELVRPARPRTPSPDREHEEVGTPAGPFRVVREDPHLLVVSKPPGCASHPALGHAGDTLIERVRAYLGVVPADPFQPALANRLDLETSGIVLVAKTRPAQRRLGRNLQRGRVEKAYLTLVAGWPEPAEGEIRIPLPRHPDSRDRGRHPAGHPRSRPVLQDALTRYRTLARYPQPLRAALLEVDLVTGRTHQIRRHLALAEHPLALDRRYGDPEFNEHLRAVTGLGRMFLHAHRVRLRHPAGGGPLDLTDPLPEDLVACLAAFGGLPSGVDGLAAPQAT